MSHDIGCCWRNDILDCSFEIIDDGLRHATDRDSEPQFPWENFSRRRSLYSSNLSSLASSINFFCLCLSSLSAGDSRNAGGARNTAEGGGTLLLAISSPSISSMYEMFSVISHRCLILLWSLAK